MTLARIKKADDELQIVYAEVYAPNRPDSDTDFMLAVDVRKMAHGFLTAGKQNQIDTQHDNVVNGSTVVESWVQQEDSETYMKDAWCVGIHVPDADLWKAIKNGDITGFSVEALVETEEYEVTIDVPPIIRKSTLPDDTDHQHKYTVKFDPDGNFLGGQTDVVDGHSHVITKLTKTESAEDHFHRVSLMEGITLEV